MKIVCDCGNETEFVESECTTENEGIYVVLDRSKFAYWGEHYQAGFVCAKCGKAIWWFA